MHVLTSKLKDAYTFIRERRFIFLFLTLISLYLLISFNATVESQVWRYERTNPDEGSMSPTIYSGQGFLYMNPLIYPSSNLTREVVAVKLSSKFVDSLCLIGRERWRTGYMHRCIWDNGTHIKTQGDNPVSNPRPDPFTVPKEMVQGVVFYIFPRFIEGNSYWNWRISYLLYWSPMFIMFAWYPLYLYKGYGSSLNDKLLKSAVVLSLGPLLVRVFIDPHLHQLGLHLPFDLSLLLIILYLAIILVGTYKVD